MDLPLHHLRDSNGVEPSPSPPLTARVLVPPSRIHDSHRLSTDDNESEYDDYDNYNNYPPSTFDSRGYAAGEDDNEADEETTEESASQQRYSNNTNSASTRPSGPLTARPLNVAPVLQTKRRSTSHYSIPAPPEEWYGDEEKTAGVVEPAYSSQPSSRHKQRQQQQQQQRTGSASSVSATRRSSVIGPDPRECIDLPDEETREKAEGDRRNSEYDNFNGLHRNDDDDDDVEPQQMRVVPLPHEFYRRERPAPPAAEAAELTALVNADTVDRCRSDSHGQILLVDDGDLLATAAVAEPQRRHRTHRGASSVDGSVPLTVRSASIRAPTEFMEEEEAGTPEDEAEGDDVDAARCTRRKTAASASASPPAAAYTDCEFVLDYFYYPAAPNADGDDVEAPLEVDDDQRTPARGDGGVPGATTTTITRRRRSTSASSSMPRWAHALAEETPFTPFSFAPAYPAGGGSAAPSPAAAAAAANAAGRSLFNSCARATTREDGDVPSSAVGVSDRRRMSVLDDLTRAVGGGNEKGSSGYGGGGDGGCPQRLTVQEVVVAVLAAPPMPPPLPPALKLRDVALSNGKHGNDGVEESEEEHASGEGPLDEPAPRKPTADAFHSHPGTSTTVAQAAQAEQEHLLRQVASLRARLVHVHQLETRFDAVIASRQAELQTLKQKYQDLAQQTESHRARAAMARKEVRRLRDRQHTREELQLLRDMLVDKENLLGVAQNRLLSLKRLRQQLDLLHAASLEKSQLVGERHGEAGEVATTSEAEALTSPPILASSHQQQQLVTPVSVAARPNPQLLPLSPPLLPSPSTSSPSPSLLPPSARPPPPPPPPMPSPPTSPAAANGEATTEGEETSAALAATITSESSDANASAHEQHERSASACSSSASSLASLGTCDILDDFLDELLMEVDGLAKVCIQLPSPPPAMSYCNRVGVAKGYSNTGGGGSKDANRPGPSRRGRPTYSALNRRLNDGNNGFFSFFGGATEAHLNSKPLSTFLANLDRLARGSWELEEEVQLRARELATDLEEEELRARLMVEYGLANSGKSDPVKEGGDEDAKEGRPPQDSLLSPITPLQTEEAKEALLLLSDEADPLAATASSDRTTRQLFRSSPEHGRRSRGGGSGLLSPASAVSTTSPLLHRPVSLSLLLPTLVYAYPRVAVVSQHLDDAQQQIQRDYASAIAAARQQRREWTARLRDAFRLHVAPALHARVAALRQQQAALALQLADLGVKELTLEWEEEEEPAALDGATLWQLMDAATAVGRRRWLGHRRGNGETDGHNGGNGRRSRSRLSAYSVGRADEESFGGDGASSSRGLSLLRDGNDGVSAAATSLARAMAAAVPASHVYRRTLHVICAPPVVDHVKEEEKAAAAINTGRHRAVTPASPRSARQSRLSASQTQLQQQQQRSNRHSRSSAEGRLSGANGGGGGVGGVEERSRPPSARSGRRRASVHSGRLSGNTAAPGPFTGGQDPNLPPTTATAAKNCAELQLYSHAPSPQLLQLAQRRRQQQQQQQSNSCSARCEEEGEDVNVQAKLSRRAVTSATFAASARSDRVVPIATSSQRCSGGTPRVSAATANSSTTPTASATARRSAPAPPSPRHRRTSSQPVSPRAASSRHHRTPLHSTSPVPPPASTAAAATTTAPPVLTRNTQGNSINSPAAATAPVVHDTRVRLSTELATTPYGGAAASPATPAAFTSSTTTAAVSGAANVAAPTCPWSPFAPNRDVLADGAVHVAITFTGAEAHRRQVAQERREAYQREFWQLREELARIDEDIFQLRTRHEDLCAMQQRIETEQAQKLAEAEAKVKKCRAFYKGLKRENKEWQDICDELQRVIREGD